MIPEIKCLIHNEDIVFIDISQQPQRENITYCLECLSIGGQLNKICQIKNIPRQIDSFCVQMTKTISLEYHQYISKIQKAKEIIINLKEQIISKINETINKCENKITQLTSEMMQEQEIYQNIDKDLTIPKLKLIGSILSSNHQRQSKLSKQSKLILGDEMVINLNELIINEQKAITEIIDNFKDQVKLQNQFKQKNLYYALACNQKCNMIVGGRGKDIVIWEQDSFRLKEIFVLQGHTDDVTAIVIYQSGDMIVSGGGYVDKSIKLWRKQNNYWNIKQTINDHKNRITDLQLTKNQEYLVSACNDLLIKVWRISKRFNELQCVQTLNDHNNWVYWISITQDSLYMVSSSSQNYFNIYKNGQDQINPWKKLNKIETTGQINRIYFTNTDELLVQQVDPPLLIVYSKNINNQYQAIQDIILNQPDNNDILFPMFQMNNSIFLKNDRFVYKITRFNTGKYLIRQILPGLYYSGCGDSSEDAIILCNAENLMIEIYK